jgi:hypothetical protein
VSESSNGARARLNRRGTPLTCGAYAHDVELDSEQLAGRDGVERCHGFAVLAGDHTIGCVETPLFPGSVRDPDFLVVRTVQTISGTFRVVSASLVSNVDLETRTIRLALEPESVASLPEYLPLLPGRRRQRR